MSLQVTDPAIEPSALWKAVSPNDSTVLKGVRSVYVGTTGDLTCIDYNNDTVAFVGVPAGTVLPISPVIIKSTGTTASNIVILQ
jgi:hypothetical protein